jgi:hypothetical protein
MELQGHVEHALKDAPTATEFIGKLHAVGVDVIPYIGKEGRATGVTFRKGKQLMKGSDLGRGFSWNALQERGLDYNQERDRPAIEASRQRADVPRTQAIEPPTISTPAPEYNIMDFLKDASRAAGNYVLDQVNPLQQLHNQVQTIQHVGQTIIEGYNLTKDLFSGQSAVERLNQSTGLEPTGKDALEKLNQVAGIEPARDTQDVLQQLNQTAGVEHDPSITQGIEKTLEQMPELTPTLEPVIEREVAEHTIELLML